jgi:hypothetical protein
MRAGLVVFIHVVEAIKRFGGHLDTRRPARRNIGQPQNERKRHGSSPPREFLEARKEALAQTTFAATASPRALYRHAVVIVFQSD